MPYQLLKWIFLDSIVCHFLGGYRTLAGDHLLLAYKIHRYYSFLVFFQRKFEMFQNLMFLSIKNISTNVFKVLDGENL